MYYLALISSALAFVSLAHAAGVPSDTQWANCICPRDKNGSTGTHINTGVFWWQCAYAHGACMWDTNGNLMNVDQGGCAYTTAKCVNAQCVCDKNTLGETGTYINHGPIWWQCAYTEGSCMWDEYGNLMNTAQTNCPKKVTCQLP